VLYLIGRQVFGQESARLAVLLAAVYPAFIVYTGYLLNETVFNFLLCLAVFILIRGLKKGFLGWYIISGIIFGIGILCKASFLLFPLFIGAAILVFLRKKRKVIIPIFAVCVAAYAVVSPWAIRNYKVFGLFIPVKTGSGVALWAASYPAWAGMKLVGKGGYPEHRIEFIEAEPLKSLVHGLSEAEADRKMSREAKENIRNHPVIFARFCLKRAALLWQYPIGRELLGQRNVLLSWLLMFLHYLLLFLAIAGMALSLSTYRNRLILVIFLVPLYFTLIYALTYGHPRYQFPAIPYILFFASYGFIRLKGGLCRCG
jgi:4-amino-4-deoxy-L-arabinose transferase-like glycosyltransferase